MSMQDEYDKDMKERWFEAETFPDLCQLTVEWLRGAFKVAPNHYGPPAPETMSIQSQLIAINEAEILTTCSQPGYIRDGRKQRAYLEGACWPEDFSKIQKLDDLGLVVLEFPQQLEPEGDSFATIVVSEIEGRPSTFMGRRSADDLNGYNQHESYELGTQIGYLVPFQIIDPVWGRESYLFNQVLELMKEQP